MACATSLPTYRAHNEQGMAHAAIAFAKASRRRRIMACTTSIGPGATNMVTAAAVAHVNRLPVLLLPGDVFANRRPDPVLQQIEDFGDGTVSANDCFRPVSRYFDRITRPEQIIPALQRAMQVLTDPAECGPVTLALCQDVQAEAYDYPESFFAEQIWTPAPHRVPTSDELAKRAGAAEGRQEAGDHRRRRRALFAGPTSELADFAARHGIPVGETQAGKSSLAARPSAGNLGARRRHRHAARQRACRRGRRGAGGRHAAAGFHHRLVGAVQEPGKTHHRRSTSQPFDATKHDALPLVADARAGLTELEPSARRLEGAARLDRQGAQDEKARWLPKPARYTRSDQCGPAVRRAGDRRGAARSHRHRDVVRLRRRRPAGRVAQALAGRRSRSATTWNTASPAWATRSPAASASRWRSPKREVVVMVGDGSYLMMNSEIATSVMLGLKLTIVLLDNRGYGCINRLQRATGGANFNNLLKDTRHEMLPDIDFAAHAASLGAHRREGRQSSPSSRRRCKPRAKPTAPRSSSSTPIR